MDDFNIGDMFDAEGEVPREPSAEAIAAGGNMFQLFTGLRSAGFSEDQALNLIAKIIAQAIGGGA